MAEEIVIHLFFDVLCRQSITHCLFCVFVILDEYMLASYTL